MDLLVVGVDASSTSPRARARRGGLEPLECRVQAKGDEACRTIA